MYTIPIYMRPNPPWPITLPIFHCLFAKSFKISPLGNGSGNLCAFGFLGFFAAVKL